MKWLTLSFLVIVSFYAMGWADSKVTALSTDTTPSNTDVLYEAKNPGGASSSKQVQIGAIVNLGISSISANSPVIYSTGTGAGVISLTAISLSSGVIGSLPAASIAAGSLGVSVLASSFPISGVTSGSYTNTSLTVNAQGMLTAASSGAGGGGGGYNMEPATVTLQANKGLIASTITINAVSNAQVFTVNNATGSPSVTINTSPAGLTTIFQVQDSTGRALFSLDGAGHQITQSTSPTLSSCGTGPTFSTNSNDQGGTVTVGSVASGCTVTFGNVYSNAPTCVVSERTMSLVNAMTYATSVSALTVSESTFGGVVFDYICQGH